MGGSLLIMFGKGQKKKVKELLNETLGEPNEHGLWIVTFDVMNSADSIWIEEKGKTGLEIGYSFGGWAREMADGIGAQLGKLFTIKKYGWDSTGYFTAAEMKERPLSGLEPFGVMLSSLEKSLAYCQSQGDNQSALSVRKDIGFYKQARIEIQEKAQSLFPTD